MCSKFILPDDIECHLVMCLTKPRLSYNGQLINLIYRFFFFCKKYIFSLLNFTFSEDILNDGKGECVICLDDLNPGDIIARLPCLCVYHKG